MADALIAAAEAEIDLNAIRHEWIDTKPPSSHAEIIAALCTEVERLRLDLDVPRAANRSARQRLAEILGSEQHGLAEMVMLVGERISELAEQNWRLKNNLDAEQFGREHERADARRELAEVTRQRDEARANRDAIADSLSRAWDAAGIPPGADADLAEEVSRLRRPAAEWRADMEHYQLVKAERDTLRRVNNEWRQVFTALVDGLAERGVETPLGGTYTSAALAEIDRLRADRDEAHEGWREANEIAHKLKALLDQAGGRSDQKAPETAPGSPYSPDRAGEELADEGEAPEALRASQGFGTTAEALAGFQAISDAIRDAGSPS